MVKSDPASVAWMVPGTTVPSRRNVWVPSVCRWAIGLVDRVEVVERAAQPLDEEEDERDGQEREDGEDPPAGPPAPRRRHGRALVDLGRRRAGRRGRLGGGAGHDRSPRAGALSRSAAGGSDIRSARSQRRRRRTRLMA